MNAALLVQVSVALALGAARGSEASATDACPRDALERASTQAKAIRKRLLGTRTTAEEISPSTGRDIQVLKDAFADAAEAAMRCMTSELFDEDAFRRSLTESLAVREPEQPQTSPQGEGVHTAKGVYGAAPRIAVDRPKGVQHLLTVTLQFGIECGVDSVLLVYEWRTGEWRRALRWQSPQYNKISGAYGDFFRYVLLPGERSPEDWVLAVAHGTPWCTSRWSVFHVDVIQRGDGGTGRVLFHLDGEYTRDEDPVMKATADGFDLRLEKGSIDPVILTRLGIFRYRISGGHVTRVQPVAMNGRDFVDEWLQASWSDSRSWSSAARRSALGRLHADMARTREAASPLTFGAVRSCSDDGPHFQVELQADSGTPSSRYFQIRQEENGFTMLDASTSADPRCGGADLTE